MGSSATRQRSAGPREGILLVDDDQVLVDLLGYLVEQAGFTPLVASDPTAALQRFDASAPLLAVIDLNLKPHDGFDLLAELRRRSTTLPILVLTARADEDDKVRALDLGADDYIVKPFGHREFLARLRAHARRALRERGIAPAADVEFGGLRLEPGEHTLHVGALAYRLTGTEYRLLRHLMRHGMAVVPMASIAKEVCGYDDAPAREAVRVTVHRLRKKLGDDGTQQRFIHTVPGIGLRLNRVDAGERTAS